jgi:hypothetical protein
MGAGEEVDRSPLDALSQPTQERWEPVGTVGTLGTERPNVHAVVPTVPVVPDEKEHVCQDADADSLQWVARPLAEESIPLVRCKTVMDSDNCASTRTPPVAKIACCGQVWEYRQQGE